MLKSKLAGVLKDFLSYPHAWWKVFLSKNWVWIVCLAKEHCSWGFTDLHFNVNVIHKNLGDKKEESEEKPAETGEGETEQTDAAATDGEQTDEQTDEEKKDSEGKTWTDICVSNLRWKPQTMCAEICCVCNLSRDENLRLCV